MKSVDPMGNFVQADFKLIDDEVWQMEAFHIRYANPKFSLIIVSGLIIAMKYKVSGT